MTKSTLIASLVFLLLGTIGWAASVTHNPRCPYGTRICRNAISMCCSICNPDPLAMACAESLPDDTVAFYEPENDLEETVENLAMELKNSLTKYFENDYLKECLQVAYNFAETLPDFIKALKEDPVKELAHLFVQLKAHADFDLKHKSCHNIAFDAISINHIFQTLENKLFLLYSMDNLEDYLHDIGSANMSVVNLARAYGSLIGSVMKQYLEITQNEPVMTEEYVDYLNSIQTSWTAGLHPVFANMNRKQLKRIAGSTVFRELNGVPSKPEPEEEQELFEWPSWWPFTPTKNTTQEDQNQNISFPANFRVGEMWPGCEGEIKDQLKCDGCWSFSAVGIMNDRFCITTGGKVKVDLSTQYILDCAVGASGCGGGNIDAAWRSFKLTGTPTWECIPFDGKFKSCGSDRLCADGSLKLMYLTSGNFSLGSKVAMKQELMKNGSIQSSFKLFTDFFAYKGGVYISTGTIDIYTPEHAVRIVGWGADKGVEYWILANSFGTKWGMNGIGYFKMDTCNIENQSFAATPDLEQSGK